MYDWANSAFATTVMAGFFPIFFKEYWSVGVEAAVSTARLGLGNSLAGISVAIMAPLIGAVADKGTARKRFLIFFAYMGVVMTFGLYFVAGGRWVMAIGLYLFASIAFNGGNIFYDSLLPIVTGKSRLDFISSLGYSLGYLGGGLLFALNVLMVMRPEGFGFAGPDSAVRFSFLMVAVWWGVFTLPLVIFVKEPRAEDKKKLGVMMREGVRELARTFGEIRKLKHIFLFLLAYWFYIDGVDTVVRMAVDYGLSIGIGRNDLILALLITQFVGFPAAIGFGYIGARISARKGIFIAIGIYLIITVWASLIRRREEFYALAVMVGLVQGGIQALSRSYYASMIPESKSGEYFGFYNMMGKFAAVIGPGLVGVAGLLAREAGLSPGGATRAGILSLSILFLAGAVLFYYAVRSAGKAGEIKLEGEGSSGEN